MYVLEDGRGTSLEVNETVSAIGLHLSSQSCGLFESWRGRKRERLLTGQ